jgi:FkbM family methyltransferase
VGGASDRLPAAVLPLVYLKPIEPGRDRRASGFDVASMIKQLARSVLPRGVWHRLRVWRIRRSVESFPVRRVRHTYGGFPLEIHLADPLAQGWYDNDWPELPEVALLRRHAMKTGARVLDLGAHQGVVALMMARVVGPTGQVVAVEANPHNARVAGLNAGLNAADNLRVVQAAVAARPGTLRFNLGLNGQADDGTGEWGVVEVPARTIDDLAREFGPPDVVFLDVEGFECEALRGAGETLARRPDVFIEVHQGAGLERFGGSLDEILTHFPAVDYDLHYAIPEVNQGRFAPFGLDTPRPSGRFNLVATRRAAPGS